MNHSNLISLFEYDQAMTTKIIDALEKLDTPDQNMIRLASHNLNAGFTWMDRIEDKVSGIGVWDIHSLEEMKKLNKEIHERIYQVLNQKESLDQLVSYKNSNGTEYSSVLFDILFHLVNHSTHHRGQIVRMIREAGLQPPVTDYIFYVR